MTLDELAKSLYGAYCSSPPRGRGDGAKPRPLPCWEALTGAQRRRWLAVAGTAYDAVRRDVAEARRRVEARRGPLPTRCITTSSGADQPAWGSTRARDAAQVEPVRLRSRRGPRWWRSPKGRSMTQGSPVNRST